MVTTPTSVKSFMLKLVELLHKLDTSRLERAEIREDNRGAAGGIRHAMFFRLPSFPQWAMSAVVFSDLINIGYLMLVEVADLPSV